MQCPLWKNTRLTLYITMINVRIKTKRPQKKKYANSQEKCKLNQQFAPPIFSSTKGFQTTDSTDLPLIPRTSHSVAGPLDHQYPCCYNTTFFCLSRFASNCPSPTPYLSPVSCECPMVKSKHHLVCIYIYIMSIYYYIYICIEVLVTLGSRIAHLMEHSDAQNGQTTVGLI